MESTINLFAQLVDNLPPLLPDDLVYRIRKELKNIQSEPTTLEKLEEKMIQIGYEIWPWNQAFREFSRITEEKMGEQFLLSHFGDSLQKKYYEYRTLGMSWADIHTGRTASYFSEDDRVLITQALIATHRAVKDFTTREVVGMRKESYLKKVEEFKKILTKIKDGLRGLRDLAAHESDHPMLANEIIERVRSFEHGLCLLAPEFEHEEIDRAHEFFVGRKQELNRLRGIHETIEIDFYNS
ncbi:MAG: hypothetical protein NT034_01845 [Candidatus Magasanikbacteria bacterium]|nr:hypothetical protein [Candidatus Magasanikbacteria bacterium]